MTAIRGQQHPGNLRYAQKRLRIGGNPIGVIPGLQRTHPTPDLAVRRPGRKPNLGVIPIGVIGVRGDASQRPRTAGVTRAGTDVARREVAQMNRFSGGTGGQEDSDSCLTVTLALLMVRRLLTSASLDSRR